MGVDTIAVVKLLQEKNNKISELEEENKTLKDNIEFLHSCLDDRDKSIVIMQEENKKLKEKVEELEKERDEYKERWINSYSI